MSNFIGNIGDEVTACLTLHERVHVGKSRPVWLHTLTTPANDEVTIFSTKRQLLEVHEGDKIAVIGVVKDHRVVNGRKVTVLNNIDIL